MQRVTKLEVFVWLPRIAFLVMAAICLGQYLQYMSAVISFQYDWGPSDGDHLNFAHRLAQGLPIYLALKEGEVLSIYTPLYHALIALLGGEHASMLLARSIAFLFWVLSPLMVVFYLRRDWGYFYATVAAIFIWLSAEPSMLMSAVYVTPTTTMVFLFLSALIYGSECVEKEKGSWWRWCALGVIAALCYLAKQQGLIAIASIVVFMLVKGVGMRKIALVVLGFLLVLVASTIYLEIANSGQYLNATLFDLNKIMNATLTKFGNQSLARTRLFDFLVVHNWAFTLCMVLSYGLVMLRQIRLNIWHVSLLLHIPLLFSILKNGGGGPDYFLTFWIAAVLISVGAVRAIDKRSAPFMRACGARKKYLQVLPHLLLILLFLNGLMAAISISREINALPIPTPKLEKLMEDYEHSIAILVAEKPQAKAFSNRNIGALIANNVDVENEGSTLFQYVWHLLSDTSRNTLLARIKGREFDLITTGLQAYPEAIKKEIKANYKIALTKEVVLNGHTGMILVYVPNEGL